MQDDPTRAFAVTGRHAVITGAASGIGRETACTLAQAGARLTLADIDEAGLAETARLVAQGGGEASLRRLDVADRDDVEAAAREADAAGGIDIWVNVAAIHFAAPLLEADPAKVERLLSINLMGSYWGTIAAGRAMVPRGRGSIVNLSSTGADMPAPGIAHYAIAKAGVNMLTQSAAYEFGPHGVRVNAVAPGFIDTPMVGFRYQDESGAFDPARRAMVLERNAQTAPLRMIGSTHDIALAILYLASDASRYVTGQVLRANGGVSMA